MSRRKQRPTKREDTIGRCDPHDIYEHPAYGTISMSVITGGDRTMFGSDIQHGQRIRIRVHRAELQRNLSNDWIHNRGQAIVELELSHSQFAEFITTSNREPGVPVTLLYVGGDMVPAIDADETKMEMFRREIEASAHSRIVKAQEQVKKLGDLIASGKTPKRELQEIHKDLQREISYLPGSVGFVVEQAEEAIEKATTAAKIELEATVNHHINRIGLNAARQIGLISPDRKEIE